MLLGKKQKKKLEERVSALEKQVEDLTKWQKEKKQQQISFPLDDRSYQILDDRLN